MSEIHSEFHQKIELPRKIEDLIHNETYTIDGVGMSEASVLIFDDKVLKIAEYGKETENEYMMMKWLDGKIDVPKVYAYERQEGKSYLLISRMQGEMACSDAYMARPDILCGMLAKALKKLWDVDIAGCPCDWRLDAKLEQARYNVENELVDTDNVEPETFGPNGFKNPEALLEWLCDNRPEEDLVLSHGDFCLPNIFFYNGGCGYIDLGRTGIADRWCDIAIGYRSLKHNYSGKYNNGRAQYPVLDENLLFERLGIQPDWDKIRYYILLDELF